MTGPIDDRADNGDRRAAAGVARRRSVYYGKLSGDKTLGTMELNFAGSPQTNKWEAIRLD